MEVRFSTGRYQYAVMCGAGRVEAMRIAHEVRLAELRIGYWLSDKRIGNTLGSLIFHEARAIRSHIYEPLVVPGLLQTESYARAQIMRAPDLPADRVNLTLRTRRERQRILRAAEPGEFWFYAHEQALRLQVGSAAVMHEQLLSMLLTAALPHVTLRIVPSRVGGTGLSRRVLPADGVQKVQADRVPRSPSRWAPPRRPHICRRLPSAPSGADGCRAG